MDEDRDVESGQIRKAMDTTRRSIQGTVDELRDKVGEAMDWRSYIARYPAASLGVAVLAGAAVGRWVGGKMPESDWSSDAKYSGSSYAAGSYAADYGAGVTAAQSASLSESDSVGRFHESWTRATSRVEELLNRLIDEAADTVEQVLVPSLMGSFTRLLGGAERGEHRRAEYEGARHRATESSPTPGVPTSA